MLQPQPPLALELVREGDYVVVTDVNMAGFLHHAQVPCARAEKLDRHTYEIVFYDPERRAEQLAHNYINGAYVVAREFAEAVRDINKVVHRFHGRRNRRG